MTSNNKNIFFLLVFFTSVSEILPSLIFKIYMPKSFTFLDLNHYILIFFIFSLWTTSILIWLYCIKLFYYSLSLFYLITFNLILVLLIDILILGENYNLINIAGVILALSAIYMLKNEKNI